MLKLLSKRAISYRFDDSIKAESAVIGTKAMQLGRTIIAIGASRGGLAALRMITTGLPVDFPAAVLIVLHSSPDSPRLLAEIIGRSTRLGVSYAAENEAIRAGHIYIAPPSYHLVAVAPGYLHLDDSPKEKDSRPAANPLFRSLAGLYGPQVIGVVLTGGDGDGADGLKMIKEAGGVTIVQEPATAVDPSMPLSALDDLQPDYCVPLRDMASLLVRLVLAAGPNPEGKNLSTRIHAAATSSSH